MIMLPPTDDVPTPPPNPDDGSDKRGRPKLNEARLNLAVQYLLAGNFRCVVAKLIGIDAATFRRWMVLGNTYSEGIYARFRAAVLMAEAAHEAKAVATITAAGQDDPKHLEWMLERKNPQRWGQYRGELGALKRRIAELEKLLGMDEDEDETADSTAGAEDSRS